MATINSPGIGSGLDVNNIVEQLLSAEARAPKNRLDRQEARLQVELSGYGAMRGSLSGLQSALTALNKPATFQGRSISSSDDDVLTVTSNGKTTRASYDIDVTQLAKSHTLSTDPGLAAAQFTDVNDVLGTGSLTFKFGQNVYDPDTDSYSGFTQNPDRASETIEITDGSLIGIRDAINQADIGATASLVFDGEFYRLAITSDDTGEQNAMQISVNDGDTVNDDASGLSLLSFNENATHLAQTGAATDAAFTVNGINITSASNTVSDAIESATINLKSVGNASVSVSLDKAKVSDAVSKFVENYNGFIDIMNQLTAYNPESNEAGALNGDALTRGITSSLRRLISDPVGEMGDTLSILSEVGVTTDSKTGRLQLNAETLNQQLDDNFERFAGLFSAHGEPSDAGISFLRASDDTAIDDYAINITTAASRGSLSGSALANLEIVEGSNDRLDLTVNGVSASIVLTAGSYSASQLAAELQAQINNASSMKNAGASVIVSESAGVLSIQSQRYGSASAVEVTGGNGSSDLFGNDPVSAAGNDVAGTIGGIAATGNGQILSGTGAAKGLTLHVSGVAGDRGTVNFNRGYADRMDTYLQSLLGNDGLLESKTEALQSRIESVNDDRAALQRRLETIETRLRAQFGALDGLIASLQSTGDYLTQQLQSLPTIGSNNK